ncbi:riboflavin kinase [Neobacillus sp. B4I6]|jgi:riboflavin kinase|uniref:hypothetical protein n=1 Tax=Neobacillus sp. B4I6 TaxID=3373925 RepID=UPI003D196969
MTEISLEQDSQQAVHLPDLHFVQLCEKEFGLNRGMYNTIDFWFFAKGISDIRYRRERILHFLKSVPALNQKGKIKFGHGGLSACLAGYWDGEYNFYEKRGG